LLVSNISKTVKGWEGMKGAMCSWIWGGACPLLKLQDSGVMKGHVLYGLGDYPHNFLDGALIAPPPPPP